jgi:hypothetical protein
MMIRLHKGQSEAFKRLFVDKTHKYLPVVCSRGWGKSYFGAAAAMTAVHELMQLPEDVPNKVVWLIAPTHDDVVEIYAPLLSGEFGGYATKESKDRGIYQFPSNTRLRLLSYETVEKIRGKGAYFVVWDEISKCTKGIRPQSAWEGAIEPAIRTRWSVMNAERYGAPSAGRALFIGTPKGYNFLYTLYTRYNGLRYNYKQSPLLDPVEIESLKDEMDPVEFATEYGAEFRESGLLVFHQFDRNIHVREDIDPPRDGEEIYFSLDFNVGIMASTAWLIRGNQYQAFAETRGLPDTETWANTMKAKYPGRVLHVYPDPTGKSRKTSSPIGVTDFSILAGKNFRIHARESSPTLVDSAKAVNRQLMTASGQTNMYLHPSCRHTIISLERTSWVEGTDNALIDKSDSVEHWSDGIRYMVEYRDPVNDSGSRHSRGFNF